jgi:hypothetical protein
MKKKGKFRKKPVVVEAYQTNEQMELDTLEGKMKADPGDWIITGVDGEQYPCKPDVFEKTYIRIEDPDPEYHG